MVSGRWSLGERMFGDDWKSDRRPNGNGDYSRVASAIHVRLLWLHGFSEGLPGPSRWGSESFTLMGATAARFVPPGRSDFVLAFAKATRKSGQVLLTKLGTAGERLRPEVSHGV